MTPEACKTCVKMMEQNGEMFCLASNRPRLCVELLLHGCPLGLFPRDASAYMTYLISAPQRGRQSPKIPPSADGEGRVIIGSGCGGCDEEEYILASEGLVEERKRICRENSCGSYRHLVGLSFCGNFVIYAVTNALKSLIGPNDPKSCGCQLDLKWRLKGSKCPQNLW